MRAFPIVIGLSFLAACGGGGGGGGTAPVPTLTAAAVVLGGAAPTAGDALLLFLSRDVQLVVGAILDDTDVTLSPGATLGAVANPPTLISARVVEIRVGAGVALTPGTTTITFSDQNDAVRSVEGVLAATGPLQVVSSGDGTQPVVNGLTLNDVDGALNGTGPAGGPLQVPRNGFTIDVSYSDPTSPINASGTVIAANVTVQTPGGAVVPGTTFTSALAEAAGPSAASWTVPPGVVFPDGPVTLTVFVVDVTGMVSDPATFAFRVRNLDDAVRPFETSVNPSQLWFLDISRDVESYVHPGVTIPVDVVAGANGRSDLEDLWVLLGLFGSVVSVNDTVRGQIQQQILTDLASLYDDVNVTFTFTAPGSFPASTTVPYNSFGFSQICVAGAEDTSGATGILGVAIFDPHNDSQDNDCRLDFAGSQRLGVFVHTMVNLGVSTPASGLFRTTYDAFTPGFSGVPIGDAADGLDPQRLSGTVQDPRATAISIAIARMARSIAVITAHECGHSMGLVRDGPMPGGLYGNDPVNFPGSAPSHIRNTALFPPGSQNVMSPAISFSAALSAATAFNSLNLAYLRERAIYNDN